MLKSEVIRVSGPTSSSRRRSPSDDSPEHEKSSKRSRRTPTSSSESDDDDEHEPRQDKDDDEEEEGEVQSKQAAKSPPTQATPAAPPRTGGLYMPPAKLRLLQASLTNKSSPEYQRLAWEALKKTINGRVNKVNTSNLPLIIRELFKDNIVRGRGLLARGIIQAQMASPFYTSVYAALVSVVNTKFPQIGELIVKRLISSFRRTYQRNDKSNCLATTKFIAHLVNQNVLHEIVSLQMLVLLLENPSDDSVELAIGFLKECGQKLSQVSPRGLDSVFSTLRNLLHESSLDKRTQYMIEVLFAVRKDQFKANPAIPAGLELVEENDQYTHMLTLDDPCEPEPMLDIFKYDEQYEENEEKYKEIRRTILDESSGGEDESSSSSSDSDEEGGGKKDDVDEEEQEVDEVEREKQQTIIDQTETNLVTLRRTIYLTIQSSIGAEECAHKLLKMNLRPGQEMELCQMILDSCAQQRTYERFFGLLGQRFCLLKKEYVECFEKVFQDQYEIVHRLENVKLRNVAKFFAHLLVTDAISWGVLRCIRLTEEDTTSSSRVYIKNLFLELAEYLGLTKLNNRLTDPTLVEYFEGIFPRDNPRNTRFSINFFTSIGLGGLTDELREFLRTNPPPPPATIPAVVSIKNEAEEDEDNYKDQERMQARLRELQMEQQKKKKDKNQKKKKEKNKHRSSSSSSSSSTSSSSSSSSSPSPPPPPPSNRTRRDERDRRDENSKSERRQQDPRSPNINHRNSNKKEECRERDRRLPSPDRRKENRKEERRERDRRSPSPDHRNGNRKEERRERERRSPSPDHRNENRKEERRERDRRSPSPDRRKENRKEERRQPERRSPSPDRRHHHHHKSSKR